MKKAMQLFAILASMALVAMAGCNSREKKVEKATEDLNEAKHELIEAKIDSVSEFMEFKLESEARISENEKTIAAYKVMMEKDSKHYKAKDQKAIDELELRNINMRKKIEEFKEDGKDHWDAFKKEFSHDMDELGSALKDLTVKNVK